ncbi:MAG: efflux RND transporter periplasmic adaptor subunit [Nitrospira sp.]|nr:efflux RND transporter periplasmic adaptor subunit [Nitrospira sp.]
MTRPMVVTGLGIAVVTGLALAMWLATRESGAPPVGLPQEYGTTMPGTKQPMEMPVPTQHGQTEHARPEMSDAGGNRITIAPERLQTIGVKFQEAARRPLDKVIRTVGHVEIDERLVGRVNLKFEGWIEDLRVSAIGDRVEKDQVLFTIYSPDLVATQEEYLLALQSYRELGKIEFPEVSRGAKDLLEATRRRLQLWDIKENHVQDLERTGTVLRTLPIHSPVPGTVIRMEARAGTFVTPGTELYFIADLSRIWILADIYEYELPFIKKGQGATVTLSYDPNAKLHGHVIFIYPTLDPKTRTAKVRFELDNPGEKLKPGMYANVELKVPLGTRLVVPRDAIIESGERQLLFTHHGGGQLEWRNVMLGARAGDWVEVTEGIKEGDHVVTGANFLIDSESQLKASVGSMTGMH